MGRWVSGGEASVNQVGTEQFERAVRLTPELGDGGCRLFGDI